MATNEQIAELRLLIGEPTENPYTDQYLSTVIDVSASLNHAALSIWTTKAATYASMVDTTESGSSRKMSQLMENALKMVAFFEGKISVPDQPEPDMTGYAYTVPIERP